LLYIAGWGRRLLDVRFDRLHDFECEVDIGEAEDAPTGQGRVVVFLDVGDEPGTAVVASADPDAAFDLTRLRRSVFELAMVGFFLLRLNFGGILNLMRSCLRIYAKTPARHFSTH
jgi:hypothetical protein